MLKDLAKKGFCLETTASLTMLSVIQNRILDTIRFLVSIHMVRRYLLLKEHVLVWMGYVEVGKYIQSVLQRKEKVWFGREFHLDLSREEEEDCSRKWSR